MTSTRPDVVVVGAGIVGAWAAYELARSGCSVRVLDVDSLDGGTSASFGNAGILARSYALPMSNPRMLVTGLRSVLSGGHDVDIERPLGAATIRWMARFGIESRPFRARRAAKAIYESARRSLEMYDEMAERDGVDLSFRRTGWLYVAAAERALESQAQLAQQLAGVGVRSEILSAGAVRELEPALDPALVGGVLYPDDISMDPAAVMRAVHRASRAHGVQFIQSRIVGVETREDDSRALVTESGQKIIADQYVLAGGVDTPTLGRWFGAYVPITRGTGWSITIPSEKALLGRSVMGIEDHVVINDRGGSVRIAGGMRFGGPLLQVPPADQISLLRSAAEKVVPAIAGLTGETNAWIGARPMTPSGLPMVRRLNPQTVIVAGHGTLGMTLAPDSARQVRSLVTR